MSREIGTRPAIAGKKRNQGTRGIPSWDTLMTQIARIIGEDALYPEEMPDVIIEVSGKTGFPTWNTLMTDIARIIAHDGMYPDEMPEENFEVY